MARWPRPTAPSPARPPTTLWGTANPAASSVVIRVWTASRRRMRTNPIYSILCVAWQLSTSKSSSTVHELDEYTFLHDVECSLACAHDECKQNIDRIARPRRVGYAFERTTIDNVEHTRHCTTGFVCAHDEYKRNLEFSKWPRRVRIRCHTSDW